MWYDFLMVMAKVAVALFCGIEVFFIFSRVNTIISSLPDYWEELEAEFSTERMTLNGEMVALLGKIGKPLDNGRFSPEQKIMWQSYKAMNKEYEAMFARHTDIIINRKKQ